ncbi:Permease of the drug/metabolite transporter (DMT) superfamily [Palleronia pelagia]|uniref:Permease of the drug/metabolite transporter (DMT) superfamily n=2 Tax=Palleronia pelagia TaxID=387096 RepID=A0A1H8D8J8_9RHOB|nr:Permease of the drug/metabolite transporter (DMT) superfamily [Palleronia pelagia]
MQIPSKTGRARPVFFVGAKAGVPRREGRPPHGSKVDGPGVRFSPTSLVCKYSCRAAGHRAGLDSVALRAPQAGMSQHPLYGLALALAAALLIAPDTLFMRLSGMNGVQMMAWRGLLTGLAMGCAWILLSRDRAGDLRALVTPLGGLAVLCQAVNALFFVLGIAMAPVAVVLFAVATVPIWSAILGAVFLGDSVGRATAMTCAVVLSGIGLSVFAGGEGDGSGSAVLGAACGLAVSVSLAGSFTVYRADRSLPILLTIGLGATLSGCVGWLLAEDLAAAPLRMAAIAFTGLVILPVSFFLLSLASRYTEAANVSLFLLLETVLGPLLVWAVIGEPVPPLSLLGGAVVVAALAVYLNHRRRKARESSA